MPAVLFAFFVFTGLVVQYGEDPVNMHMLSYVPHHICAKIVGGHYSGQHPEEMAPVGGNGRESSGPAHVPYCRVD